MFLFFVVCKLSVVKMRPTIIHSPSYEDGDESSLNFCLTSSDPWLAIPCISISAMAPPPPRSSNSATNSSSQLWNVSVHPVPTIYATPDRSSMPFMYVPLLEERKLSGSASEEARAVMNRRPDLYSTRAYSLDARVGMVMSFPDDPMVSDCFVCGLVGWHVVVVCF